MRVLDLVLKTVGAFCIFSLEARAGTNNGLLTKSHLAGVGTSKEPHVSDSRGGLCVQVPIASPYPCEKDEEVERGYPCDTNIEREVCEYIQQSNQEECSRLKSEIVRYPCYSVKKDKVCWKVPQQKDKKCKKVVKKQIQIESERTVRRETCEQKAHEVNAVCWKEEKQTMAYMCYKPEARKCKTENVTTMETCKKRRVERKAYPCEQKSMETVCEDQRSDADYHGKYYYPQQVCHEKEVSRKSTCYRNDEVEVNEPCEKKEMKTVCERPMPKPDTCEKSLPTLKAYDCKSTRHREECSVGEVSEKTVDYLDKEEEETYDCPYTEEVEECSTYETVVSDVCENEIQKVEKYPCPKPLYREVCHVKPMTNPHTCYTIDNTKRKYTCYDVEYKLKCYNKSGMAIEPLASFSASAQGK
eukprot:GHVS01007903.1.p1 GENE.GHVS01007903.1~~GHVS01007903.1.p1  ORF type:complete len:414 (-),score=43.57 GHVS01007903.1:223-1464(-)